MSEVETHLLDVMVGRQAIFGSRMELFAYELLYRNSLENEASFVNGNAVTARVLLNTFLEIGLDQVVGSHSAFLNVTRQFILDHYCHELPKDRVVIEILEDIEAEPEIVKILSDLSGKGYKIALDDFVFRDSLRPFLELADFIKIDVQAKGHQSLEQQVEQLRQYPVKLLAEKVETWDDFSLCKQLGFEYFQGYFFCRPTIVQGKGIPANQFAILSLLSKLQNPLMEMAELEELIKQDLSLSFKILRYVNSAYFGLPRKVSSIGHAAIMVGTHRLKMWATLIALGSMADKPSELLVSALVRAKMCERLAQIMMEPAPDVFFTVGLFSVLEALFDSPMTELVEILGLSPEANGALINREGKMGQTLACVIAYNQGEWELAQLTNLSSRDMRDAYLEAIAWTGENLPLDMPSVL